MTNLDIIKDEETILEITPQLANKVIQNLSEGVVITDIDGTILHVNQAFCKITGYTEKELLGGNPRILKSNLHDRFFYHKVWNSIMANGSWKGEIWNRHKNGRLYLQKLYILPIRDETNNTVQYLGVSTDISEEDRIQKDINRTSILQKSLLPVPIHHTSFQVESVYSPANYLSGDFYDYFWDQESQVLSGYMIDIMGHGLTAAFQQSILRVLFNQGFTNKSSLSHLLTEINRESKSYFLEDTFAAALCFQLDFKHMNLSYACAGLNKFLIRKRDGNVAMVKQAGPYLGIMKDVEFEEETISIESGDSIFLLTDGFMDFFEKDSCDLFSSGFKESMSYLRTIGEKSQQDDASAIGILIP